STVSIASDSILDLNNGALVLHTTSANRDATLAALWQSIRTARNSSPKRWRGMGLTSSAAAVSSTGITGLALIVNDRGARTPVYPTFAGQSVDSNCILVKYTYDGDMDLNGKVDGADYFLIDNGFLNQFTGYRNGDLDYNGKIDGADYFLIDNAFLNQGGTLG